MSEPTTIETVRENVVLRQLTAADQKVFFATVEANRDHLTRYGEEMYLSLKSWESAPSPFYNPNNPDQLLVGIWRQETFLGAAILTPYNDIAEIGYWLDERHTGQGYGTLAVKALATYAQIRYPSVFAEVAEANEPSIRVLKRAGFIETFRKTGRLVFELLNT